MEHVVEAQIVCTFDRIDVGRLLDYADQPGIAGRAGAIDTGINVSDVVADRAKTKARSQPLDGLGKRRCVVVARTENVECEALGSFGSHPGKLLQLIDEPGQWLGKTCHSDFLLNRTVNDSDEHVG